jgi:hypothetical protein
MEALNPYAAPRSSTVTVGRGPYVVTVIGLWWYALLGLASAPFAVLASSRADQLYVLSADRRFNLLAGTFYGIRAISDLGLVVAFVAGLVWLHHAWRRTETSKSKIRTSAWAVVGWTLVPVWGFWRLHGFLLELSRRNGLDEEVVKVTRWWFVLAAHLVVRTIATRIHIPGWFHVGDSFLQATAALLGIQMLSRFNRALT